MRVARQGDDRAGWKGGRAARWAMVTIAAALMASAMSPTVAVAVPEWKVPTSDRDALPRTIVTTDGEADDMNSMMRFLYYTNEIDVDGLVYSSSIHHWAGDGVHTLREAHEAGIITSFRGQSVGTPERSDDAKVWRWNPDAWIEEQIHHYAQIQPNLRVHDPNYPSAEELLAKVAVGNIDFENDFHADTPGSDLIKDALLDDDPRDLWLQAWGGQNTIARALLSIEEEYAGTPQWDAVRSRVVDKAVIATISFQDNAYQDYISKAWPDIRMYNWGFTFTAWVGAAQFQNIPDETKQYYKGPFLTEHIKFGHGPLLEGYRLIGDGQYLEGESDHPGWQPGRAGIDNDLATWRMFGRFGPFERYDMVAEGDTPSFLPLIDTGLRFLEDPTLGSWGGRFASTAATPTLFTPQGDINPVTGAAQPAYSLFRWVPDVQDDFAARADWGVTPSYEDANHPPEVSLKLTDVTARPGATVKLQSQVRDPDGDTVTRNWAVYSEASTVTSPPKIRLAGKGIAENAFVTVPADAEPGQRIVLTLTATDDGEHTLTRYGQVVITVS